MKKLLSVLIAAATIFMLVACSSSDLKAEDETTKDQPTIETAAPATGEQTSDAPVTEETTQTDDRGIAGMDPYALQSVLSGDPFYIPSPTPTPSEESNGYCASTCSTTGGGEGSGVIYDYSMSLDNDGEIVGASFGITGTTASEQQLLTAADLYFYAVSLMSYDTGNSEDLGAWFNSSLKNACDSAITITVGDAVFELYGIPGITYWVDISKI